MTLDHSPTNPQASASHLPKERVGHLSLPSPAPAAWAPCRWAMAPVGHKLSAPAARPGIRLRHFHEILVGRMHQERAWAGAGRRVCRSDSSAPPPAWEAGGAASSPGLSHPPGRAFPPAGFLQSRTGRRDGAEGPRGLAGLVPGFLSAFPEQERPGDGTRHKPPSPGAQPGPRVLVNSGSSSVPGQCGRRVRNLSVLAAGGDATHSPHEEAERRNGRPHDTARVPPHHVSLLAPYYG